MADTLKLDIIPPQATVFSGEVEMVTLPGVEGELGVYPNHVRLVTQMVPGQVTIRDHGAERLLAVGEGLIDISATRVSVVTDMAVDADRIDEAAVEDARARAAARLQEKISDEEVASVNASLARSLAQLQVKRRRIGDASRPR
jgi:F-type H+-transporting ATPase subunit epsilon